MAWLLPDRVKIPNAGGPAFTHISYNDYLVVAANLLEKAGISIAGQVVPYCIFTDPELTDKGELLRGLKQISTVKELNRATRDFDFAKLKGGPPKHWTRG